MATTPNKKKGRGSGKCVIPAAQRDDSSIAGSSNSARQNSAEAQRNRLLAALKRGPVDTQHASRKLDIIHPPRRVFELRNLGHDILTGWCWRTTEAGESHRVGIYRLVLPQKTRGAA